MMFAIGITDLDLGGSTRHFDVFLKTVLYQNNVKTETLIPLEPCSYKHWNKTDSNSIH